MKKNRESLMINLVDRDKLAKVVRTIAKAQYGLTNTEANGIVPDDLVIARDPNPKADYYDRDVVIICSEGVGWTADEVGLYHVPCRDGMAAMSVLVSGTVLWKCRSDEQVDLATFIRTFGDRLEANFLGWHATLTAEKKSA